MVTYHVIEVIATGAKTFQSLCLGDELQIKCLIDDTHFDLVLDLSSVSGYTLIS